MRTLIIAALLATASVASADETAKCANMVAMLPNIQKAYVQAYEISEESFDTAEQSASSNQAGVVDKLDQQMTDLMSGIALCRKFGYLTD